VRGAIRGEFFWFGGGAPVRTLREVVETLKPDVPRDTRGLIGVGDFSEQSAEVGKMAKDTRKLTNLTGRWHLASLAVTSMAAVGREKG